MRSDADRVVAVRARGAQVALLGPDGAGKDRVIEVLARSLDAAGVPVRVVHFRPGFGRHGGRPVTDPHAQPPRGRIASALKLAIYAVDYWWAAARERSWRRGGVVLFNRHFDDLLVDPGRYRYGGGPEWVRRVSRRLPGAALHYLLDAPPEVLLARKREVPPARLAALRAAYLARAIERGWRVLDATRTPEETAEWIRQDLVTRAGGGA